MKKNGFWANIKWFFKEWINVYSDRPSFFSKKRVESGIGFIIAEWGMIYFLLENIKTMGMSGFALWASIQFFVAGYMVNQIQKEKNKVSQPDDSVNDQITDSVTQEETDK
jgi:hypothetical protein